jgi:hypothetical protein
MGKIVLMRLECRGCGKPLEKFPDEHTSCGSTEHPHYACPRCRGTPACVEVKLDPGEDGVEFTSDPDVTVDGVLPVSLHRHPLN